MLKEISKVLNLKSNQVMMIVASLLLVACIVVISVFFAVIRPMHKNVKLYGDALGDTIGTMVGTAIGSRDGILIETPKGIEDGKAQGLSAEDTTITIREQVTRIGNLEVLRASVSLSNEHTYGKTYKNLKIMYGNLVFTTDLTQAQIQENEREVLILLPGIQADLNIDKSKTETLAEYARPLFNGSAKDGLEASINSMKEIEKNAKETIKNYDVLMEQAKSSAQKNVTQLVEKVTIADKTVTVKFMEEGGVS